MTQRTGSSVTSLVAESSSRPSGQRGRDDEHGLMSVMIGGADNVPTPQRESHRVQWSSDVIDNENMNKKKSKSKLLCWPFWNATLYGFV